MNMIGKKQCISCILVVLSFILVPLISGAEEDKTILASQIIDEGLFDEKGEQIGEVDDLVIRRNGKIKKVTMEVGGFLGIGDKLIAMPFVKLKMEKDGRISVSATQAELEKRPEFDYYRQNLNPTYSYRYYPYGHPDYPYGRARRYPPRQRRYTPYDPYPGQVPYYYGWAHSPSRFLASVVIDKRVMNEEGVYIGEIKDLLVDLEKREIQKVILLAEDIRGEDSYVAAPYKPLGMDYFGYLLYDISEKKVKALPEYQYEEQLE